VCHKEGVVKLEAVVLGAVHAPWPLHDIVITNIVWCVAYKREIEGGVVCCPLAVQ